MDFSEWLRTLDWSPLFISIKTGIIAVFISFFLGIFAAWKVVHTKSSFRGAVARRHFNLADGSSADSLRFLFR